MSATLPGDWTLDHFTSTIHQGKVGLWSWDPEARTAELDTLAQSYWGLGGSAHTLDDLFDRIDERDRTAAREHWLRSATSPVPYEFEFRLLDAEGNTRWISARGVGGRDGVVDGQVLAVFADVTELKRAEETRDLALREMTHRIANLFAVAASVTNLSARNAASVDALAADLTTRFDELGRAFRYAADPDEMRLRTVPLCDLLRQLLAPHDGLDRVEIDGGVGDGSGGGDVPVGGVNITNVALIVHELATNALKHGALSDPAGRVVVRLRRDGPTLALLWREIGGPGLERAPGTDGNGRASFGTRLVDQTVRSAFGGTIERRAENGALAVEITLTADRLSR